MSKTKIAWTEQTWNPVVGCTKVSDGCKNCYAEKMAYRLYCMGQEKYGHVTRYNKWSGHTYCDESALQIPLKRKKPTMYFVCSMGDLFHESVPFEFIKRVRQIAIDCPQHTMQFLTKRPERALKFTQWLAGRDDISIAEWPRNCWLGVTVENQEQADKRIPILLQIPAAVRFVSCEPLLGVIDLTKLQFPTWARTQYVNALTGKINPSLSTGRDEHIDWVIVGGESGRMRRDCPYEWIESIVEQCKSASVPVFVKQIPFGRRINKDISEFPPNLQFQEYPK